MLPQLKISVNGSASAFRTAERGVLFIEVSSTAPSQADASSNITMTNERIINNFRRFALKTEDGLTPHPSAGITTFSSSAPTTSSSIPRDSKGEVVKDAPREYKASTTAEVVFRDLDLLSRLASELAAMQNVSITRTEWRLTDASELELSREARIKAIKDAVQKAEDYASVVGREVVAVKIEDGPASRSVASGRAWGGARQMQGARKFSNFTSTHNRNLQFGSFGTSIGTTADTTGAPAATPGGTALEPGTITMSAHVDVEFISRDGQPVSA
ncbi:hypothetical protein SLS53_002487 [Cytospora paraplurivora]|uniref:SIMPL domain-containing protein n=1 Tax=Cytospora paraplurivora TaxID=2898453 RepID=A0AAN9UCR2_9PEZI